MAQEFVVYFNNRRFVITPKIEKYFESGNMGFFFRIPKHQDFSKLLEIFQTHKVIQNLFVGNSDTDKLFEQFALNFTIIDAAGGLVQNDKGEFLLIFRRNKWDLPKGKVEKGEEFEVAALREVEEETGVSGLSVQRHLTTTYHTYVQDGVSILKRTFWFAMKCYGTEKPIPQTSEDIVRAEWVSKDVLPEYLVNTFGSIHQVLNEL